MNGPTGIAVGPSGDVYVVEYHNHRIQKFTCDGTSLTKWGDGQLSSPYCLAVDASDNVYVADHGNHRIQKFTSTGTFLTKWGSFGSGDGQFNAPYGVAVDALGDVYVGEISNQRIQKFTSTGAFVTKWGSYGSGDGQFNAPGGMAMDASGNVYVVDINNDRIQVFAPPRGLRWVGTGNYATDGVDPDTGDPIGAAAETVFTFKVEAVEQGIAPTLAKCMLRYRDGSRRWTIYRSLNMAVESGSPATTQVYSVSTKLPPGQWQYRCRFDAPGGALRGAPAEWTDGPVVNTPPSLRWVSAPGFDATDGVNPNSGAAGTRFDLRVGYAQAEGRVPTIANCEIRVAGGATVKTSAMRTRGTPTATDIQRGVTYRCKVRIKQAGSYEYRFRFHDGQGWATGVPTQWTSDPTISGGVTLGLASVSATPTNTGAQVSFSLTSTASVSARVLNVAGRPVRTLARGQDLDAGANTLLWNAQTDQGLAVPSGAYLVEVVARGDDGSEARAVTQLRISR